MFGLGVTDHRTRASWRADSRTHGSSPRPEPGTLGAMPHLWRNHERQRGMTPQLPPGARAAATQRRVDPEGGASWPVRLRQHVVYPNRGSGRIPEHTGSAADERKASIAIHSADTCKDGLSVGSVACVQVPWESRIPYIPPIFQWLTKSWIPTIDNCGYLRIYFNGVQLSRKNYRRKGQV